MTDEWSLDDELDEPKPGRRTSSPTDRLDRRQVAKATGSKRSMMGQYVQRTMRLKPETLDAIRDLSQAEGISMADAERWLIRRGLMAYYQDDERPTYREQVQRKIEIPDWGSDD